MIRILRHTLCLALLLTLAACSKEEPGYNPRALVTPSPPWRRRPFCCTCPDEA